MKHYGDITKINGGEVPAVDVVTFGAPCQDLSVAGLRHGMRHEALGDEETTRSGLFYEAVRIIKEMRDHDRSTGRAAELVRPRFAIYENVPGALSSNGGKDWQAVIQSLIQVVRKVPDIPLPERGWPSVGSFCGVGEDGVPFSLAYKVHDAQYWGVPQRRKRLSIVVDYAGFDAPWILFDPQFVRASETGEPHETVRDSGAESESGEVRAQCEGLSGDTEPGGAPWQGAAAGAEGGTGSTSYGFEPGTAKRLNTEGRFARELSPTLRAEMGDNQVAVAVGGSTGSAGFMGGQGAKAGSIAYSEELSPGIKSVPSGSNAVPDVVTFSLQGGGVTSQNSQGSGVGQDVSFTLNTMDVHGVVAVDVYNQTIDGDITGTVTAAAGGTNTSGPKVISRQAVLAFTQNQRDEVRNLGDKAGAISAEPGMKQQTYICEQNRVTEPTLLESNQNHATVQTDGISTALPASMVMGGGYVPMIVEPTIWNGKADGASGNGVAFATVGDHEDRPTDMTNLVIGTGGNQVNVVCCDVGFFESHNDQAATLLARQYKDPPIVTETYQEQTGSLCASGYNKNGTQEAQNGMYVTGSTVRRLTPDECASLQGFPRWWCNIGEWTDSKGKLHKDADSPKYKAYGNSIAVGYDNNQSGFWCWLARRICAQYERRVTMASLFDGIGGFPLAFSAAGAIPVWASEIEEFPIAVTKLRFPEVEE